MTEKQWLTCDEPSTMLETLRERTSARKLRLFGYACCERVVGYLWGESRIAAEKAELFADGLCASDVLQAAIDVAARQWTPHPLDPIEEVNCLNWEKERAVGFAGLAVTTLCAEAVDEASSAAVARDCALADSWAAATDLTPQFRRQAELLRDIFGNPFRPVAVDPAWLTSTVVSLARGIYDERAFDRMPILADALQDAGCDNADVLEHCRGPGPHVRGCWVVDLLLGKE